MSRPLRPLLVPSLSVLLQQFFCQRLIAQRRASPETVASYRDAFRLLLRYAEERTRKPPVALALEDLDAPLILGFLDHLEAQRGNSPRSRNARLAAIRSFLRFASFQAPASLPAIQRVLAIPMKRIDRPLLGFLSRDEVAAILAAPDMSTWSGHRDHVLLTTLYNTGARVSEIVALRVGNVALNRSPFVRLHGKGRKERAVPLWRSTATALTRWLRRTGLGQEAPLFPNWRGTPLSRSGVEHRLRSAIEAAQQKCPSLRRRGISPHSFRHTTAMHLLQSGTDVAVIALWLGHESPATTHLYVEADLTMKQRALEKLQAPRARGLRFRPDDRLLAFLDSL
jgi:integrase/recombinase XerD